MNDETVTSSSTTREDGDNEKSAGSSVVSKLNDEMSSLSLKAEPVNTSSTTTGLMDTADAEAAAAAADTTSLEPDSSDTVTTTPATTTTMTSSGTERSDIPSSSGEEDKKNVLIETQQDTAAARVIESQSSSWEVVSAEKNHQSTNENTFDDGDQTSASVASISSAQMSSVALSSVASIDENSSVGVTQQKSDAAAGMTTTTQNFPELFRSSSNLSQASFMSGNCADNNNNNKSTSTTTSQQQQQQKPSQPQQEVENQQQQQVFPTVAECLFGPKPPKRKRKKKRDHQDQHEEAEADEDADAEASVMATTVPPPHVIDMAMLRRLAARGLDDSECPDDDDDDSGSHSGDEEEDDAEDVDDNNNNKHDPSDGYRALVWRVLLGYLPLETDEWNDSLKERRELYNTWIQELFAEPHDTLHGEELRGIPRGKQAQAQTRYRHSQHAHGRQKTHLRTWASSSPSARKSNNDGEENEEDEEDGSYNVFDPSESSYTSRDSSEQDSSGRLAPLNATPRKIPAHIAAEWKKRGKDMHVLEGLMKSFNALKIDDDDDDAENNSENEAITSPPLDEQEIKSQKSRDNDFIESAILLDEVRKDVVRTQPDLSFYLDPNHDLGHRRYAALERILFVWAKYNKGVRYVQGMNEIVGAIYYVLAKDVKVEWAAAAEADTYWLLNTLLSEMRDVFVPDLDTADTGIQGRIKHMQLLLQRHDPEVYEHLADIGIDASFYAVRWWTTLLSREFLLPDTIRLWDSMFASTHKDNFMRYVCVTMVMVIRDDLLKGDFSTCIRRLQGYPSTHIDALLESSRALWMYETQITVACHKGGISRHLALQAIAPPPYIIMAFGFRKGRCATAAPKKPEPRRVGRRSRSRVSSNDSTGTNSTGGGGRPNSPTSSYAAAAARAGIDTTRAEVFLDQAGVRAAEATTAARSYLGRAATGLFAKYKTRYGNQNQNSDAASSTTTDSTRNHQGVEVVLDGGQDAAPVSPPSTDDEDDIYLAAILNA